MKVSVRDGTRVAKITYSWTIVWAAPHPAEKAVKMKTATTHVALRPSKSLNFAQITRPASSDM